MPLFTTPIAEGRPKTGSTPQYIVPGVDLSVTTTSTYTAGQIRYHPIFVVTPITLDQILIEVTTQASSGNTARLGIYQATTDWQPGALVVDAGTVATDSQGVKAASISVTLSPGRHLLALNCSATINTRIVRGGVRYTGLQSVTPLGANTFVNALHVTSAYAVFADPGTAWDTVTAGTTVFGYGVFLRVSTP